MPPAENRLPSRRDTDPPERLSPVPSTVVSYEPTHLHVPFLKIRDALAVLNRGKWLILALVAAAATLTTLYTLRTPPIYEANATVRVESQQNNFLRSGEVTYAYRSPEDWNTQLKTLQSPQLIRQVALYLRLPENASVLDAPGRGGLLASLRRVFRGVKPQGAPGSALTTPLPDTQGGEIPEKRAVDELSAEQLTRLEPYVALVQGGISVKPLENTNLISISFRHHDPALAMSIVNAVAKVHVYNENKREKAGSDYAVTKLAKDIVELQQTVVRLEGERIEYLKSHDLPLGQAKGQNLTVERLGTVSDQLLAAEEERRKLQASYVAARKSTDPLTIPEVYEDTGVREARDKLAQLENARAKLLVRYTEEWPPVKEIDLQTAGLKGEIEARARNVVNVMGARYEAALAREGELRQSFSREHGATNQQSQSEIMLSSLNQRIETNKQLYNQLFQRQKELEIESNGKSSSVSVESPSSLPTEALPQGRAFTISVASLCALFAGVVLSFLLAELDERLKTVEDVDRHLHLPTLALIPTVGKEAALPWLKSKGVRAREGATILKSGSRSLFAESFVQLATALTSSAAVNSPRVILMTSGQPGEGKTMAAVNTAITLASRGEKVLIMDCDLRRPQAHTYFDLPNDHGLTNCIASSVSFRPEGSTGVESESTKMLLYRRRGRLDHTLVMSCLHAHPGLPNLRVMTAGWGTEKPTNFLASEEMSELLSLMRELFSYVIIDSPPICAFADASELARHVDGAIIVVDSDRTSRKQVQNVKRRLADAPVPVLGVALNHAKTPRNEGYYSYYNYYPTRGGDAT
jgi:succinoglycan biosynthesis transport protein ExoP